MIGSLYGTFGTENGIRLRDRLTPFKTARHSLSWNHGFGSTAPDAIDPTTMAPKMKMLSDDGWPIMSMDMSGNAHWGGPAATGKMANQLTQLAAIGNSPYVFLGGSMGALAILCSILAGTLTSSQIAAIGLIAPVLSLVDMHDQNRGGYAASIETAHGVTGTYAGNSTITARDPAQNPSSFAGITIKIWYGLADTVAVPSVVTSFVSAVGSSATAVSSSLGHTQAVVSDVDLLNFVRQYGS